MQERLMQLASEQEMDFSFQQDNMYRRMRRLICFDMDSTLIETEVIDELAIRAGVGDEVKAITESAMRGEIDFTESFTRRVALLKGLDESVMQEIAESLPITEGSRPPDVCTEKIWIQNCYSFRRIHLFRSVSAKEIRHRLRICERIGNCRRQINRTLSGRRSRRQTKSRTPPSDRSGREG